jgi:hypothetical protein
VNPQNLLADAERLRIRGTHDPLTSVITWEVQTGGPPGSLWEQLLAFEAPVGDDPATAYAIPEGLECLVTTAASFYGLNVHVEPVRSVPSRVAERARRMDATMQGAKAAPVEDFRELTRRLNATLDAAILPPGQEAESVPAPRCEHNFLTPHTVTVGRVENGYIERKCPGGTDPGPVDVWPHGSAPHVAWLRSIGLCAATTTPDQITYVCDTRADHPHLIHADHAHGYEHEWAVVACDYCDNPREWPASQALCTHPLLHAPEPPEPRPGTGPHPHNAPEQWTPQGRCVWEPCPVPKPGLRDLIRADHDAGRHEGNAAPMVCRQCREAQDTPEGTVLYRDEPRPVCGHGQIGPHGTDALDRGPTCPGPNAIFRYEAEGALIVPTCRHGETNRHPLPGHDDPRQSDTDAWCDGPTKLPTQGTPKQPADPAGPVCAQCERAIWLIPGAGFGGLAEWRHRDPNVRGHQAVPRVIVDPMPEACRRHHPGEQCRPGDNHPDATPTGRYVTDAELR